MQSRIVVSKLNRVSFATPRNQPFGRAGALSTTGGGVADTNVHGGDGETEDAMSQGVDKEGENGDTQGRNQNADNITPTKEDDSYVRPKIVPPNLSSPKIETPAVNSPLDPHLQQKRRRHPGISKEELTCAGMDGSPWPEDDSDLREQRKEQEKNDKEYFEHHKAFPLSDIEIVDSRKPLTRVITGTADGYFGDEQVMTWRPEQLDTAEDSLRRAAEMFRQSAMRGVPEHPHSRRLRELRGEDW